MTALTPPSGAVAVPSPVPGCIAAWRHADRVPHLEVRLFETSTVTVTTGPASVPIHGITDPRELRQCAWLLLRAADWLDRAAGPKPEPDPDPQLTIDDALAEVSA